jgi:hypothetical protein
MVPFKAPLVELSAVKVPAAGVVAPTVPLIAPLVEVSAVNVPAAGVVLPTVPFNAPPVELRLVKLPVLGVVAPTVPLKTLLVIVSPDCAALSENWLPAKLSPVPAV